MKDRKPSTIADGTVEGMLAAIANPKPAKGDDQGQGARDMPGFAGDQLQGQQHVDPMPGQGRYLRETPGLRETTVVEQQPAGGLPRQVPDAGQDELIPSIVPSAPPGSRKP